MSWGVRRIEDEQPDPAYGGGRRSAMTVGEWLDQVSAGQRGRSAPPAPAQQRPEPSNPGPLQTLDRKLEELNRRLKRLADAPKNQSRDRRPDRDGALSARRSGRDRAGDDRDLYRDEDADPLSLRLEAIDRKLSSIAKAPPAYSHEPYGTSGPERPERAALSDVDRLRQGLREIERLQSTLLEGLNERGAKAGHAIDRYLQDDRQRANRQGSLVAETIARLETEVRGLRQTVESRLEPAQSAFDDEDIQDMRRMLHRLAEVGAHRQDPAQVERLFDEMNRLRDLVIETGGTTAKAFSAKSQQEARLADMVERLASVATSAQEKTSDDMRALERRLATVGDRIADLEAGDGSAKDLADLQRAIDAIAAKLDRPVPIAKPVIPAGLIDLDIRIEKLSDKLDRIDVSPTSPRQMAALETEIAALRLDLAQSANARGSDRLEEQFGALGARIDRLADATASRAPSQAASLERFETRIGDLVDMLDRMVGSEASLDKHVDALQGEVSALRRDLAGLADPARDKALEQQFKALAERLENAGGSGGDPRLLAKIDEKIGRLGDLLTADQRRSGDIGGIETKLGKIELLLADRREDALEAASAAAREAVREFASIASDARQSDAGVRALETDLRQVQEATRTNDARTSDALQSVHDALSTIVSRLGAIERGTQDRPAERDIGDRSRNDTLAPNRSAAPQIPSDTGPTQPRAMPTTPIAPDVQQVRIPDPPAASAEDHRPLEPGSGKPRPSPQAAGQAAPRMPPQGGGPTLPRMPSPADSPAQARMPAVGGPGQVPRQQVAPTTMPMADEAVEAGPKRNDFIAAARRAAMAASQAGPGGPPPIPGAPSGADVYAGVHEEAPAKKSLIASLFKRKPKALVMAGIGIALAATAASFVASSLTRTASTDSMPTASVASAAREPSPAPAAKPSANAAPGTATTVDPATASLALAPPSSVTSTFSQPIATDDSGRQAALADAMKQAALADAMKQSALAQGIKPGQPNAPQAMPAPATTINDAATTQSIGKPAQSAATGPLPMAIDKIGSQALRSAAANGDPKAQFEVGMRFSEGRGLAPDMQQAAIWFERAASKGFQPAAYRLGSAYEKGLGVDRNPIEAKRWYRQAAEAGNIRAMHNLGVLYANDRDMPSALPWFQKAAEAGLKDSQFNLGIIYALGSGVKQDLGISYKWFALGAAQGDQEAVRKRDDIATHLDHTALAAAKMAVSTWRAAPISRDANEETAVWSEPATASAQPTAAPNAPPPPNGWTRIMQVQAALQGKGLYSGKVDGELTPETKAAIKAFQKKSGLRQNGEIDNTLVNAVVSKQM